MTSSTGNRERSEFPALSSLRLGSEDLDELANQGFISPEQQGLQTRFKLRFRRAGRQVVRYIRSEADATAVAAELAKLQSGRRIRRQLAELNREASNLFRKTKIRLQPILEAKGWKFHGRQIRRPRRLHDECRS